MQSVYGLKVTLYYTTNPFICKYFFSAPQTVTAVFRYFSGFGCKIFRGDFVVIAENLYKIAAGRKTAAGDMVSDSAATVGWTRRTAAADNIPQTSENWGQMRPLTLPRRPE